MGYLYDQYLKNHKDNVKKAFEWIKENAPELLINGHDYEWRIVYHHDWSKTEPDEYKAYNDYFYGPECTQEVVNNFNKAWLLHIHRNSHHWQHWVLINDDPAEGIVALDMPYVDIIEMICDWWSFSWRKDDLFSIFSWYECHKDHIRMSDRTRKKVEEILEVIKSKLMKE